MAIVKNSVVSLHYEMYDANNQLLDKTEEPIAYLHGGYDGIFPLVEEALHGKDAGDTVDVALSPGDTVDVALSPDDAFGEQDPELVRIEDVGVFPVEVEVGMMFEADDPETGDVVVYRVTNVADGKAVVDGNHPLAGMKIRFKATVESVRDASDEEIAHGHVHGPHGHHHH
ncbi:TPA: peptidylprolyl isomerase [Neisseria meningitidis]